ncbi:uncharacterized protein LOC142548722 [Primulina tabacum]|uniref:uncharacterized protein LOC142548722 n=1 Tax=Primulina tabacum TaxID=48773 RepID=UPI003F5A1A1F
MHIPNLESVLCQQEIGVIEPELNYELIIEIIDGTFELKNVEVFPDDIYLGDIVDAAKFFRCKGSSQHSKEISLAGLCNVVESANSMNASIRQNISSFVDEIEEILMKQMHTELQYDAIPPK